MQINENDIEAIISRYEVENQLVDDVSHFITTYPMIAGFLMQESNNVLTGEEQDLLWFIAAVILGSCRDKGMDLAGISVEQLSKAEEDNWSLYDGVKGPFTDKADLLFQHTEEEDLLSFVEDMVAEDEDSEVTEVGREVLFVVGKSLIDQISHISEK